MCHSSGYDKTLTHKWDGFQRCLFALCRKLRRDNPSKILVNLCVALALSNLVFVVGMHPYALDNMVGCKVSPGLCDLVLQFVVETHPYDLGNMCRLLSAKRSD